MAIPISFDSHDLQTDSIVTQKIPHTGQPNKDAQVYPLSHSNKSAIPYIDYPNKSFTISGVIIGSSLADRDSKIDTFNSYFTKKDANLDIGYGSGTRRYIATAITPIVDPQENLNWASFSVTFFCTLPFGYDTTTTNLTPNLLANGDFESNTTGWAAFNGSTISQSTTQAFSRSNSLRVITTSGANKGATLTFIPVSPNTTYTLSAYIYVPSAQAFSFEVDEYNVSSVFLTATIGSGTGNSAFQRVTLTFTTSSTTTQIQFFAYLNGNQTWYIDGVQLELGSSASTLNQVRGRAAHSYSDSLTLAGSAPFQLPIITVTLNSVTGGTGAYMLIGNNATGQAIYVQRNWVANDVLVIDPTDDSTPVTINGVAQDFSGALPQFAPGAITLGYIDNFTTSSFDISVVYTKAYL